MSRFREIQHAFARHFRADAVHALRSRVRSRSRVAHELVRDLSWPPFAADLPLAELRERYELPSSRYVDVDGVRVHVAEEGQGPTLVLVHGLMASLHTWDGWTAALRDSFRVVRLDLPGFGLTGPDPEARYDGVSLRKFFEKLRVQLGIERMFLAGNSLGGFVSWSYAVAHPERVEKLVLLDPLAYAMEPLPFVRALGSASGRWLGERLDPRASVARGVADVFGDVRRASPEAIRRYQDLALRPGNRRALGEFCSELMRMAADNPYEAEIARLRVPTLLLWGELDRWIAPSQIESWRRDVPGLRVKTYPGVGHVPMEEIPEESARDAKGFFTER